MQFVTTHNPNDEKRGRPAGPRRRTAFTLLEVILALALTTVVVGLIGMAIHVNFNLADKSRRQVEEAQLARALLQRIAEDLRNAVPYSTADSSSSGGSSSSSGSSSSLSGSSDSASSLDASDGSATEATPSGTLSGGLIGDVECLQVDTSRRPWSNRRPATASTNDGSPAPTSDVTTVIYCLGNPGMVSPTEQSGSSSAAGGGLYRRAMERNAFLFAVAQGQTDLLSRATDLLGAEVVNLRFTYYDGTTSSDTWDSSQQGKLPTAVKVTVALSRPNAARNASPMIYDLLVTLPNDAAGFARRE